MSYIRSESIAAGWSKACSQGGTQEQWSGNGSGLLGMAIVTAKAANRERWKSAKATRDCIPVKKKNQSSFNMAKTNIFILNSSPLGKLHDPISPSRDNQPSPLDTMWWPPAQLLPVSSLSLPR